MSKNLILTFSEKDIEAIRLLKENNEDVTGILEHIITSYDEKIEGIPERETVFSCEEYRVDKDTNDGALFAYDKEGVFITCINAYINLKHFKLIVEDILKNGY